MIMETPNTSPKPTQDQPEPKKESDVGGKAKAKNQPNKEPKPQEVPKEEKAPEEFVAEAEKTAESIGALFDRSTDMPSSADRVELRSLQASIKDLVQRAAESNAGASDELNKLREERNQFQETASRNRADFLNYQKRAAKDLVSAEENALRGYMNELLPVLDSFELTLNNAEAEGTDVGQLQEALKMLGESLKNTLEVRGLKNIEALGQEFDPNLHEAIATRPVNKDAGEKPNTVVDVARSGWMWKDKLLRPAQVLVTEA